MLREGASEAISKLMGELRAVLVDASRPRGSSDAIDNVVHISVSFQRPHGSSIAYWPASFSQAKGIRRRERQGHTSRLMVFS